MGKKQNAIDDLIVAVVALEAENNDLQDAFSIHVDEIEEFEADIAALEAENAALRRRITALLEILAD